MLGAGVTEFLLRLPRREKRLLALASDATICAWTAWAALYLRLEEWVWLTGNQWLTVIVAVALAIPIFIRFGLYRTIFRHTGWPAMLAVTRACLLYGAVYALIFTFVSFPGVPRTVGLIQPVLLFLMIGASRAFAHYLLGGNYRRLLDHDSAKRVVVYGAGVAGRQLVEALSSNRSMHVVGFFDDDRSLHGALVQGLPVFDPKTMIQTCARNEVTDVLLALPSATRRRRRHIVELLIAAGIDVRTLPGLADIASGDVHISDIRPVQIEDLLGRDPVQPDQALMGRKVRDKVVLVTGGGGSIGSELCRQILALKPRALLVVDSSEFALYSIHRQLEQAQAERGGEAELVALVGSVQDEARMRAIVAEWRPDTIYHAAAYKHVPLVEANPVEGIKNNVLGTLTVARLALEHEVADMVLISTDKAVRPTNVMGASKRLAEMVLQGYAQNCRTTCFSMVRFGNVLGSSGSVVPLFREQIAAGGPVTVTDPEVTRFFMTLREAAQLVIQASAMATGGEVFVLDMGEPVKIRDLAVGMIELSGLKVRDDDNPDGDIEVAIIGLRPGEKLYEELLIGENPIETAHPRIMQARESFLPLMQLEPMLERLQQTLDRSDADQAVALLNALVPEYRNQQTLPPYLREKAERDPAAPAPADGAVLPKEGVGQTG